ncbi:MAG: HAD hydrolase-like protein [Bacteroidales bacterium]|nr:HAD hydrolase-like protein [Bacteroidales bacterium]
MTPVDDIIKRYTQRTGITLGKIEAVLFDMDGVLYDSMPGHARAWKIMTDAEGIDADENEFYAYEGRTGASTINILFNRQFGRDASQEEIKRLYGIKTANFKSFGEAPKMPGAERAIREVNASGAVCVLVTGSGQGSLLEKLNHDYPGAFAENHRVTAWDVTKGKPDPEPYIIGMKKAGVMLGHAIGVDNAPLGVESSSKAGLLTIGVRTGPIPEGSLLAAGADVELNSMNECADLLSKLLYYKSNS